MPHVAFVPFTGLRVRAEEMLELGMSLPGLASRAEALSQLPALGLLTLAGMTGEPWTASYHEAARPDERLIEEIAALRPTLVALSALTASIDEAYRASAALRARGIAVVIGGLHVTACPEEATRHCNAVVVGEGEPVWQAVLDDALLGKLKPVYRATKPFDLAKAPAPRFDLAGALPRPRWTLQTERGCPFACDFCGASRLLGPFREKPIERIREELKRIGERSRQGNGPAWLELADDNTFAGHRDEGELLAALGEANVRYFTEADWRIGERPQLLAGLAASGCVQVLVGIESLVFRYPGMGAKQAELDRMMDAVQAIQDAGVVVNGCFIVGADGETNDSLDRLIEFVNASPLAEVQITLQTPFPGTKLYRDLAKSGRLLDNGYWGSYTLFDVTYHPAPLSVEDLAVGLRRVLKEIFSPAASERRSKLRKEIWRRSSRMKGN